MERLHYAIFILFFSFSSFYAQEKKILQIERTKNPPKIDGVLDDEVWKNAQIGDNFIQFGPDMGAPERPHQKNQIQM
ncbi:MAG: hypothetical protein P8X62_08450, partial [Flavobacteriaceae bacterium]